jgi:hypothetical protein
MNMRWFPGLRQDWLYCLHPLGEAFARVTPEAILQAPVAARLRAAGQGPRQARCHRCPAIAAPVWNGRVDHKCGAHGRNPKNDRQATEIIDLAGGPGYYRPRKNPSRTNNLVKLRSHFRTFVYHNCGTGKWPRERPEDLFSGLSGACQPHLAIRTGPCPGARGQSRTRIYV